MKNRRLSEAELDAELRAYLDLAIRENIEAGMTPEEARRHALTEMEGMTQVKERCRERRAFGWLTGLSQDVRCAGRNLARHPGFTAAAALSLALGIGANGAIFSVFYRVLLEPLPYKNASELATAGRRINGTTFVASPELAAWRLGSSAFAELAGWQDDSLNLTGAATPERMIVANVTPNFLSVLGLVPALGRDFNTDDGKAAAQPAVLLTQDLWRRQFRSDPNIAGRNILLNDQPYLVAGVLPRFFRFPGFDPEALVCVRGNDRPDWSATRVGMMLAVGRLRPGATTEQASVSLDALSAGYRSQMPAFLGDALRFKPVVSPLRETLSSARRPALTALLGAVGLLMLIACVNVANLQLARATLRRREIGLRAALGASRGRIARWLVVENLAIGGVAGLLGAAGAYGILALLHSAPGLPLATPEDLRPGWMLWCAVCALSAGAGLIAGFAPVLAGPRVALYEALKSGSLSVAGTGKSSVRSALVMLQVTLALTLLIGSGLLLRSLERVLAVPLGFHAENLLTAQMRLSPARYNSGAARRRFVDDLLQRTRALPGVQSAGITTGLPLAGYGQASSVLFEGRGEPPMPQRPMVPVIAVTPDYFQAMGIPVLRGRGFTAADDDRAPLAAVVTQTFAAKFYPGADAPEQRIKYGGSSQFVTIAGVVADVHHEGRESQALPQMFLAYAQAPGPNFNLTIRTRNDPSALSSAVRAAVLAIDKNQPVYGIKTMEARVSEAGVRRRVETLLLAAFGLLALCLAAVGIYGVVSEAVGQRTHEIGVRMALGARPGDVTRMVLRRSMILATLGIMAGIGASFYLTRFLESLLFDVKATDTTSFAGAAVALLVVALPAGYLPARRAARIDPAAVLRGE